MIGHVRAASRLVSILVAGSVFSMILVLTGLVLFPFPQASQRARQSVLDVAVHVGVWLVGMRIEVIGKAPTPPFFLVANHLGYIDILLVRGAVKARFVSKAEVASWPVFGWLASLTGTLFLERRNKRDLSRINSQLRNVLESGHGLIVFPEGTSSSGSLVKPFHAGLLAYPAESGLGVHTATLHYSVPEGSNAAFDVCWWGDMTFLDHLYKLLLMPGFTGRITFGPAPVHAPDRKDLALDLREGVLAAFEQIDGAPPT
ncbi:MAG: 1-acyl-sn-glycerol-3-phosphate acyltransferase [Rhodothermales bacterium]|jgi:1-acyl-sn-glycerol-3-phosphate acyltransferase